MTSPKHASLLDYALAVVATALATLLTLALRPILDLTPAALLYAAVMISAWHGGLGPGILATALGTASLDYLFIAPMWSLTLTWPDVLRLTVFALVGLTIVSLTAASQRTARALQESNETLQALVRSSGQGIVVFDSDAVVRLWNPAAERILGWTEEEALGRPFPAIPPESWAEFRANFDVALAGRVFAGQVRRRKKDGSSIDLGVSATPLRDATGRMTGVMAVIADVTEGRRVEEALRESEQRFRLMADTAPMMVWMSGPDKRRDYFNKRWLDFTGRSLEEELGDGWTEGVHPDDYRRCLNTHVSAFDARQEFTMEYRLRRFDGQYGWILNIGVPRFTPDGGFAGYIGSCVDISDRRHAEDERLLLLAREQRARADAEAANRIKDEFLATLSHELRSPLNAIAGWAQVLRWGSPDPATVARAADAIGRNVTTQTQLIGDLLDVSRIITGNLRLEWQAVDLTRIIAAALEVVRPAAEAKAIRLDAVLDPRREAAWGDPDRLQQVVWNLLSNAVRFTPGGGRVEVRLERTESQVQIRVKDTGQGIAAEFLPAVFDRFRQADDTTSRVHGGLGLGLAIVRHLVELHGGTVQAQSPGIGRGATFTVTLPIPAARPRTRDWEDRESRSETDEATEHLSGLGGVRVLVVEDDADARTSLTMLLEKCGARVTAAASASEALAVLERETPDVLVSDIGMAGEDGYALIRRVRARPAALGGQVPAVALTGYVREQDAERTRAAGYQSHLPKPVRLADLTATLASLVGRGGKK